MRILRFSELKFVRELEQILTKNKHSVFMEVNEAVCEHLPHNLIASFHLF
jgi:hypothetical protein